MPYYGKGFNDGDDNDSPRFIPAGKRPVDFIPAGKEHEYTKDSTGNWWKKKDWDDMKMK